MPNPKSVETPPLPPVYFSKDLWYVRIPTTSSSGAQIFRSPTLQGLIEALQRAQWHSTWFLREQNRRIKTLEASLAAALKKNNESTLETTLKQNTELLTTILRTKTGNSR